MVKWKRVPIRELYEGLYDGPHATPKPSDAGPVFLGIKNVTDDGHLDLSDIRHIAEEDFSTWTRRIEPKAGDIVFTYEATLNRYAIIPDGFRGCLGRRMALIRTNPERTDTRFLFYYFFSPAWREVIKKNMMTGATVDRIPLVTFPDFPVHIPPLPVQRRIAGILSAYDELIENSQRRIRILESMARALYREWFVHFRFPDHKNHSRVASPIGDLPKGWECVPLSSVINVTHGYAFQGAHFSEGPTSRVLATPGNFQIGGGIKYDKLKFYQDDAPLDPDYVFQPMDLMLTMTDLSKAGDTLGYPAFVPRLKGLTFLHNQRVGRAVPVGDFFPKHFLYCLFCDERYRHHIVGGATGTSVKHTSPTRILGFLAAMPKDKKLIHAFDGFAKPVFEQIGTLIEGLQNLRRTRDLLLPRLLAGQIQPNGEKT